ncbi:MAG: diacylglycerol kinase family protein [Clostridia bacterium]|nr:diacylglycerol kinase family protein [Clostridia bacterium]
MAKTIVLYNPLSGSCSLEGMKLQFPEYVFYDVTELKSYEDLFSGLTEEDALILCGGDGTLNRFVNDTEGMEIPCDVLYYPAGSGNDFSFDVIGSKTTEKPYSVKKYFQNLPSVTVNGKTYRFLNGVGFGIDGYCCEEGDRLRSLSDKPVNYTAVAIKGLLFHYKRTNAKVTVDGKEYSFRKVWLAPTMFGRYYGGGMMPTPGQTREDDTVATLLYHNCGKLRGLIVFPSMFKGKHVKHKSMITVLKGKEISVEFDSPRALQIDGETICGVTSYQVTAPQTAPVKEEVVL